MTKKAAPSNIPHKPPPKSAEFAPVFYAVASGIETYDVLLHLIIPGYDRQFLQIEIRVLQPFDGTLRLGVGVLHSQYDVVIRHPLLPFFFQ
jgi:hypothetical protein